ncbi:unnamed protein product [Pseudo-nitzschia multistriata]|uniref:Uncharacterized protein n=1 Tax=Pseudo-nitzschia multistriata TaxID=183589 RepID=A0A448YVI3_9STRA|nr:unnamed protein product [Pseudo-nitzschia multistriata]
MDHSQEFSSSPVGNHNNGGIQDQRYRDGLIRLDPCHVQEDPQSLAQPTRYHPSTGNDEITPQQIAMAAIEIPHSSSTTYITGPGVALSETTVSLPPILRLLFGLNGLALSLLTLPIMYILNTRVEVPLPYLPAYGAIAFLPYSLKPMYAYASGLLAVEAPNEETGSPTTFAESNANSNSQYRNGYRHLRLFSALLTCNSVCTLLFACIPKGGVIAVLVVAFFRGITDSWAEFCLGLTLIDHARARASEETSSPYDTTVSKLQAEAATAGNLGAWLASFVTCLLFAVRYAVAHNNDDGGDEHSQQLSGGVANALVFVTASMQLMGAFAVFLYNNGRLASTRLFVTNLVGGYRELRTTASAQFTSEDDTENDRIGLFTNHLTAAPTELDSLRDEESSHPSYSSLEDLAHNEDSLSSTSTGNSNSVSAPDIVSATSYISGTAGRSPTKLFHWILVVLLQCILVIIALKGPIVEWSSHFLWSVSMGTLLCCIILTVLALFCGKAKNGNSQQTLRVGLYLVLRNAVPSDSAIIASFFYSLFGESQPFVLQLLGFLGMGVGSLSSLSYTKFFSTRFSTGRPLLCLMGGTVLMASVASLLNIAVFREYQHTVAHAGTEDSDAFSPTSPTSTKLFLIAVLAKFATAFFEEWAFLPELVLATTSVNIPIVPPTEQSAQVSNHNRSNRQEDTGSNNEELELSPISPTTTASRHPSNLERNSSSKREDDKRIAMEYGTLVSCIDFGDQLGSLMAAPLVAALSVSRDNNFLNMDRLILICAVANVIVTIGLLPLLTHKKTPK